MFLPFNVIIYQSLAHLFHEFIPVYGTSYLHKSLYGLFAQCSTLTFCCFFALFIFLDKSFVTGFKLKIFFPNYEPSGAPALLKEVFSLHKSSNIFEPKHCWCLGLGS